jgi:hypothetical protein
LTYLSNVGGAFHVPGLGLDEKARVLLCATPREDRGRACGVRYLEGVVRGLEANGIADAYLDDLACASAAVR